MYKDLIGIYLNGFKIVRIEKDPFIKGQINLWTDEEKTDVFGDRHIVKFFIREESNSTKVYQELVDKEKHELQEVINKLKRLHHEFISKNSMMIFENNKLIEFMNNLISVLKEVE